MKQIVGDVPLGGSPFPPIADYAFLSDCETTALVAPSGNIEWMCLPRMDGPSIFGTMLDQGVFLPPSQFETCFISLALEDEMIEKTVKNAALALHETFEL